MFEIIISILSFLHVNFSNRNFQAPSDQALGKNATDQVIIWNVGQGQWVSVSTQDSCYHFDMGGEKVDWKRIELECGKKTNLGFFSHWDIDHLSFVKKASKYLANFCVAAMPRGPAPSVKKQQIFSSVEKCTENIPTNIEEIFKIQSISSKWTSNDFSRVFEFSSWMLAQGDSPKRQEKIWAMHILQPQRIKVLILGHHGSRTSTSSEVLQKIPNLKMAISSARIKRYGHPHAEVLRRLKDFGVACLRTEEWGNIHIEKPVIQ